MAQGRLWLHSPRPTQTDVVFVLEESKREFDLDSLTENLMLMIWPFVVGLYELKTTNNLTKRLSST